MYVVTHSLADGVANVLVLNDITDNPSIDGYPNIMVNFSFLKRVLITLVAPLYFFCILAPRVEKIMPEKNCFKTDEILSKLNEVKRIIILPDLSLERIKKRC